VIDALPMPVWVHDADGDVVHGNARWKTAMPPAPVADADQQWTELFHPDDRANATAALRGAVASQGAVAFEARVRAGAGTYRQAVCDVAPYADTYNRVPGYIGYCSDVSVQRHVEQALAEMRSRVVSAQEEERTRIARELHDDLGQQTALLATKIEMLLRSSKSNGTALRKGIAEAQHNVQDLAVSIHNLAHELHPPKLKLLGLVRTLESLCRNVSKESGIQVPFATTAIPAGIRERVALCVCRVAQEALQNAVKHSGAQKIDVSLSGDAAQLTLRVSDAGRGFDPLTSPGSGIGLLSMRERVELNGGRLLIEASPSAGTTIEATLPIGLPY
jgi:signal transduction histidine kinase